MGVGIDVARKEYTFLRDQGVWARRRGSPELAMRLFSAAANYATIYHPGFFVDPVLENELLGIGRAAEERPVNKGDVNKGAVNGVDVNSIEMNGGVKPAAVRKILHVASAVSRVGGHCRTMVNWIRNDRASQHTIVLLRQIDSAALEWFETELTEEGVEVVCLNAEAPMLRRAMELRSIARRGFAACFNHVAQAEAIHCVAFAVGGLPPVALVDHADHSFWLGCGVVDLVVHQRPVGQELGQRRRLERESAVLPIPLKLDTKPEDRRGAREKFDLAGGAIMALTVGRKEKYRPDDRLNFFQMMDTLTMRHPDLVIHVVGVKRAQAEHWSGCRLPERQLVFHGQRPVDPALLNAADIYLESYPFGSQTAFLEAACAGIAPVRAPTTKTKMLVTSDSAIDDLIQAPDCEFIFQETVSRLILDRNARQTLAAEVRRSVIAEHVGDSWNRLLEGLYDRMKQVKHQPAQCPVDQPSITEVTPQDEALHQWHRHRGEQPASDRTLRLTAKWFVNDVMTQQIKSEDLHLLSRLATRSLCTGHADRSILGMGLLSMIGG